MSATVGASALDATVKTEPSREVVLRKARAAVEYEQRQVDAAQEGVDRVAGKPAKFREMAEQAENEVAEAIDAHNAAVRDLRAAEDRLAELEA